MYTNIQAYVKPYFRLMTNTESGLIVSNKKNVSYLNQTLLNVMFKNKKKDNKSKTIHTNLYLLM